MPTKNPRLNVVIDTELYQIIEKIAEKEGKSLSVVAKELMEDAIEKHEDLVFSQMAAKRDIKNAKVLDHANVWK